MAYCRGAAASLFIDLLNAKVIYVTFVTGNGGCTGGWMQYAIDYVAGNRGIDTEVSYPYQARVSFSPIHIRTTLSILSNIFYMLVIQPSCYCSIVLHIYNFIRPTYDAANQFALTVSGGVYPALKP